MPNVYVRAAALSNVAGRVDYISNPKRQEHLVAVYSDVDQQFWIDLASHCKRMSKEAGHEKTCEGREWHGAIPNVYAGIFKDREEELAKEISGLIKEITGTENIVALHWNKRKTNFHFHVICSENKEINEITYGAVLTRNTYYNADGKRSTKKECVDPDGNLFPGCKFYKKGDRIESVKRFGSKENLRDFRVTEKIKQTLVKKFNQDLQTEQFQIYREDGMHLKTQKVGKGLPEELKIKIEEKNKVVKQWNNTVDELLEVSRADCEKQYNIQVENIKYVRADIKKYRMTEKWISAVKHYILVLNRITQKIRSYLQDLIKRRTEEDKSLERQILSAEKERPEKPLESVVEPVNDKGSR